MERATEFTERATELANLLEEFSSLAIICHNNPDPDSVASGLGLQAIASNVGVPTVDLLYSGTIAHQQYRSFVNLFDINLLSYTADQVNKYDGIAFVDHSHPGVNNHVPTNQQVDIVIDRHPNADINARFIDHRNDVGSTTSIVTEYLDSLPLIIDEELATALLFAIRSETEVFIRGARKKDYQSAAVLHERADVGIIRDLANPPLTAGIVDALSEAINNREIRSACLVTHTGCPTEHEALPQAADYLINLENVATAIVAGIIDGVIHLIGRSNDPRIHVGNLLHEAFKDVGRVGGHSDMAGGEIPLGLFVEWAGHQQELIDITAELITRRVFSTLHLIDS